LGIGLFPLSDEQMMSNSFSFVPKVEVLSNPESGFVWGLNRIGIMKSC